MFLTPAPPSPGSEYRVRQNTQTLQEYLHESPHSVPGILSLLCTRYPLTESTIKPKERHPNRVLPLADDEEQWERWTSGQEKAPASLTNADAKAIRYRKDGRLPVSVAPLEAPTDSRPAKKRKLTSNNEVRTTSHLTFPTVKRLTVHDKGTPGGPRFASANKAVKPQFDSNSSASHQQNYSSRPLNVDSHPHMEAGFTRARMARQLAAYSGSSRTSTETPVASQEISLHVDSSPITVRSSMDTSFDLDASLVSDNIMRPFFWLAH